MTSEEIESARRFHLLGRRGVPWLFPSYTEREWRMFNLLPSFGLVGNRGFMVRYSRKFLGIRLKDKLKNYNIHEPRFI